MKLVFLHGAGSSSLAFYYQLRHFRNSKAIDLPGHPNGKPCSSIEGYVEWVRGFNAARRYKDVVLCGHAMGGAIALMYALKYPEEVKGLILIGTGARLRVHPSYLENFHDPEASSDRWLEWQKAQFKSIEPDIYQVSVQRAEEIGPAVALNDLVACDQFNVMDQIEQIQVPTHIMCGSDDDMTPVKYSDYLAEHIHGAEETVIPGGRHFVQMEKYHKVNQKIEEFLASFK